MKKSFVELVVGSLEDKRAWRKFMKRVNTLPEDYRFAYKKILHYCYNYGCDFPMLIGLLELFEENSGLGRPVLDVVGSDVAAFCDELIRASAVETMDVRDKLNQEILEYFHREGK